MLILSFDGGGVLGALSAALLRRLEERQPGLFSSADMLAGTSTGGLIALGLAAGYEPEDLVELYERRGGEIFAARWGRVFRADYSAQGLERVLADLFPPGLTLGDLSTHTLVTAYHCWRPGPVVLSPRDDAGVTVIEAARATSAAPTYFPATLDGMIDGGVVANNPSMCAIAEALSLGYALKDIRVLSIGTGRWRRPIRPGDWGLARWAPHIIPVLMGGGEELVDYQARALLGDRYVRINPDLPASYRLDQVEAVPELVRLAEWVELPEVDFRNVSLHSRQ